MEPDKYRYSPLSGPRQIRLLRLHPRDDTDDSQLSVDLIHVALDEAPSFEALSYAWGNPLPQEDIRCCGLTAKIGLSLHGALRQLAPRTPEPDRLVWADALCINQEDMPERSAQVRIMGDIYATASKTVIWLGEEDDGVTRAMEWLKHLCKVLETFDCPGGSTNSWEDLESKIYQMDFTVAQSVFQEAFGDTESHFRAYRDIWILLRRPWFTRKWVIQEVAKSIEHEIILVAGSKSVAWTAFKIFILIMSPRVAMITEFIGCCSLADETSPGGMLDVASFVPRAISLVCLSVDQDEPLLIQVAQMLDFLCSDPRDHIFALLGIVKNKSAYEDLIDYESPISVLSYRVALASLNDTRDLQALWSFTPCLSAELRQSIYSVSWMPDLGKLPDVPPLSLWTCIVLYTMSESANASGATRLDASVSGKQLQIMGRIVDRLEQLAVDRTDSYKATFSSLKPTFDQVNQEYQEQIRWLDECQAISEVVDEDKTSFLKAFFMRDLEDASLPEERSVTVQAMKDFPEYRRILKAIVSAVDEHSVAETFGKLPQLKRESFKLVQAEVSRKLYRLFGRTLHGRMGWAPRAAEAGDFICVFDGMALPYAVRPKRDAEGVYELVGECYISGLMAGQAMDTVGVQSTTIRLE